MPENYGCPSLFLPDHSSRHVKPALLHVIACAAGLCPHAGVSRNAPMPRTVAPPAKGEVVSTPM